MPMWAKRAQQIWDWRGVWIGAPIVAGLVLALRIAGWLQPLEWMALDQYFRWRPPEPPDSRILIVGINEQDLQKHGWPVSDAKLAQLINKIKQQNPLVIGLDLYRDLPVEPGHQALVNVFKSTPNLIGIEKKVGDQNSSAVAASPILKEQGQIGVNDIVVDADGKLRRGLLFLTDENGETLPSLGLMLAFFYLEHKEVFPDEKSVNLKFGNAEFVPFEANDGGYINADAGGYQTLLNYRGPADTFKIISMSDVLTNNIPPDLFKNRIVFIGPVATSLKDYFYTPYSTRPIGGLFITPEQTTGVEIQANLSSQIISAAMDGRPLIKVWPDWQEGLGIVICSYMGGMISWTFRSRRWMFGMLFCAGILLIFSTYHLFILGWWVPVVPPLLSLIGSAIVITAYVAHIEREERNMVMNLFGRHVTPQIAEVIWKERHQIIKKGRMVGQKAIATVLFTDIKNFSTIAETSDPEVLMAWLNEYMEAMAGLVLKHGGIVDKFIGDSVMAVFGVPIPRTTKEGISADAISAVNCALEMAVKLRLLNQQWDAQGCPTIAMRVGISTGTVVLGSLGSQEREDFTIIGDSVNVAARLESFDKSIDGGICRILISEDTYVYVQNQFSIRSLGNVSLKGRQKPVKIYHVILEK
jgi:adenylate cyclase